MDTDVAATPEIATFNERIQRIEDAVALKETDKIPFAPFFSSIIQRLYNSNYRDLYYNYHKAGDAYIKFYKDYPLCDAHYFAGFTSGKANEIAGSNMIDWPGRPGTKVSNYSSHQVIEHEYMTPDEYPELLKDYTGFMIRKYIPRAYDNLQGFKDVALTPTIVLNTTFLSPFYSPAILETAKLLSEIAKCDAEAGALFPEYNEKLANIGMPPMFSGISQAPYDILGDYFRGTIGLMEDLFEHADEIEAVCDIFADQQISALQYFRSAPMPVKRVFFPLHKGMDGFMNPHQYKKLYWKPLKKIMMALIDMGVTPLVYTEGRYNTRLEQLSDIPKGKVIYHFESVEMEEAKRVLGGTACISGNLSASVLEFGKKDAVINYCKYLIDTCAPGGGYIFDTNACLENATRENLDAMFNTVETYK